MSVESIAVVLNHSRARENAKLLLLGIANHDGDGGAWPSVATLAQYLNLEGDRDHPDAAERRRVRENHARVVRRLAARLEALGELERVLQAGGTVADDREWWERPNLYRIRLECPPCCDHSRQHRLSWHGERCDGTERHGPPPTPLPVPVDEPTPVPVDNRPDPPDSSVRPRTPESAPPGLQRPAPPGLQRPANRPYEPTPPVVESLPSYRTRARGTSPPVELVGATRAALRAATAAHAARAHPERGQP